METIMVDQLRADTLLQAMVVLKEHPRKLPEGFYSAAVELGVAMLIEPVNDAPFVFEPPNVVHRFESERGSGTEKLRQRMAASLFFAKLVDAAKASQVRNTSQSEVPAPPPALVISNIRPRT